MCPLTGCKFGLNDMLEQRYLEQLFRQNYSEMNHLARVLLGNDGEADDVVQDIFLRIADSDIPPKSNNYLLVAVRNACLNRIRQKQLHEMDGRMEEPHRSIFHLRFDEDLTIADIARRLGLNPNTTYKYLAQCMEHIRKHFNIH